MCRFLRRFAGVFFLAAVLGHAAPSLAQTTVTDIALTEQGPVTRLVVELSHRANYQMFLLNEPMRLVIDLPPVEWRLSDVLTQSGGVVAGYRFGRFDPKTSRLVVDLAGPARVRQSGYALPQGRKAHRLVLDLERVSASTFAAEAQPWASSGAMLRAAAAAPDLDVSVEKPPAGRTGQPTGTVIVPPPPPPPPAVTPVASAAAPRAAMRRSDHRKVIALDAGHGGVDPGAIGTKGTREKDITLAFAREVRRQLMATGRYRVFMTRNEDTFIRLRDRIVKARDAKADLFLSIHADSMENSKTRGASIYTLSETASDAEAAALAQRENRADIIAGINLAAENKEVVNILIDLAQRETMNHSAAFAAVLVRELGQHTLLLPNRPHRFAGFAVLKAPDVPSVLLELGYLSNRKDEMLLKRPHYRSKVAASIVRAIDAYFAETAQSSATPRS